MLLVSPPPSQTSAVWPCATVRSAHRDLVQSATPIDNLDARTIHCRFWVEDLNVGRFLQCLNVIDIHTRCQAGSKCSPKGGGLFIAGTAYTINQPESVTCGHTNANAEKICLELH